MRWLFFMFLLFPVEALAGVLTLEPPVVENGGVALLRWSGYPPAEAVARFNGRSVPLRSVPQGLFALLGTDLELPPGSYPVEVTVVDSRGEAETRHLRLEVRQSVRAEEWLTLPPAKVTPHDPAVLKRIEEERTLLADLFSRQQAPPLWESFSRPVTDPVGSPFGLRRILNGLPKSPHAGVDFRSAAGTPVHAAARGKVAFADDLFYTGKTVILDHGEGLFSLYAHLQSMACRTGELLEAGAVLGRVGSTGRSTGPHLHWGVKLRGDRVDPLALAEVLSGEKR